MDERNANGIAKDGDALGPVNASGAGELVSVYVMVYVSVSVGRKSVTIVVTTVFAVSGRMPSSMSLSITDVWS